MIKSFKNKALEKLFFDDDRSKIKQDHIPKLLRMLDRLDASVNPQDMNLPGYKLHELKGKKKGTWAVSVSGNWRITFEFEGNDAINVDYIDYHQYLTEGFDKMTKRKPTHPGEIIREDIIKPLGITVTDAAKKLGVTRKTLSALINCRASLSPEMAIRIAKSTNTTPESWLFMQAKLDLWNAADKGTQVEPFLKKKAAQLRV